MLAHHELQKLVDDWVSMDPVLNFFVFLDILLTPLAEPRYLHGNPKSLGSMSVQGIGQATEVRGLSIVIGQGTQGTQPSYRVRNSWYVRAFSISEFFPD